MSEQKFHVGIKALILNDKNEILILKKEANAAYSIPQHWDLPGGRIKECHDIEKTLKSELEEELGVSRNEIKINKQFHAGLSNPGIYFDKNLGLVLIVYLCDIDSRTFNLSKEHSEFMWADITKAKKLLSAKFCKEFIDKLDELIQ